MTESKGSTQGLEAVDPEGDTLFLSKWTEDAGNGALLPDTKLTVSYRENGAKSAVKPRSFGDSEAYALDQGLWSAPQSEVPDAVDGGVVQFLIADLRSKARVGGAA